MAVDEIGVAKAYDVRVDAGDFHVPRAAGGDVNAAGLQWIAVARFADMRGTETIEACGETVGEGRRHVLSDHRWWAVFGEGGEQRDQRFDAARGRADGNDAAVGTE